MTNYGFVTFSSPAPIPEILKTRWHVVDGRTVDVKRSRRNESPAFPGSTPIHTKKIFVGNLKRGMTSSALQEYFGRFSPVSNVNMIMKHNKPRGFAFLTFGSDDDCRSVLNSGPHVIGGQEVSHRILELFFASTRTPPRHSRMKSS